MSGYTITRWDEPLRDMIALDVDGWSRRIVTPKEIRCSASNDLVDLVEPWLLFTVAASFPCHDAALAHHTTTRNEDA